MSTVLLEKIAGIPLPMVASAKVDHRPRAALSTVAKALGKFVGDPEKPEQRDDPAYYQDDAIRVEVTCAPGTTLPFDGEGRQKWLTDCTLFFHTNAILIRRTRWEEMAGAA